jgi:hypothetical protein
MDFKIISVNEICCNFLPECHKVRLIIVTKKKSHHHASKMKFCVELMTPFSLHLLSFKQGDQ